MHAIVEGLFRRYIKQGMTPEQAFIHSSESITGPITKQISKQGIKQVMDDDDIMDCIIFKIGCFIALPASFPSKQAFSSLNTDSSSPLSLSECIMYVVASF